MNSSAEDAYIEFILSISFSLALIFAFYFNGIPRKLALVVFWLIYIVTPFSLWLIVLACLSIHVGYKFKNAYLFGMQRRYGEGDSFLA